MRSRMVVVAIMVSALMLSIAYATAQAQLSRDKNLSNLKLVQLKVGETFEVTLKSNITGAFVWYVDYDNTYISLVKKTTSTPKMQNGKPETLEFDETFEFKAEKAGNTMLICFARDMLNDKIMEEKRFLVSITQ